MPTQKHDFHIRYNGRKTGPPNPFPPEMEEACQYIEDVVNEEMRKRKRFPLEWGGNGTEGKTWRANVAASNCYEGTKESVGPHSDQLTYLGPYPTIASLSLGMALYSQPYDWKAETPAARDDASFPTT